MTALAVLLSAALLPGSVVAIPAAELEIKPDREVVSELEAIEAPRIVIKGRVLRRDGITGVERATVRMTSTIHGIVETARSGRGGKFKIRVPAGEYELVISRSSEIYESPSTYRIVPGRDLAIDFLLLRDFEGVPARSAPPIGSGPAPRREPAVVGSVVDVMRETSGNRKHRWREALAFLGSLLAVAVAAD